MVFDRGPARAPFQPLAYSSSMTIVARWLFLAGIVAGVATSASAQNTVTNPSVVLVQIRASELVYPAIAQSARVSGTIDVRVGVRPDGSVAEVTTFPLARWWQMLQEVATVAAAHASFECRGCTEPLTAHTITFVFSLDGSDSAGNPPPPTWKQIGPASSEVTIVRRHEVINPRGPTTRVLHDRAARCLWLWRCGG